MVILDEVLKVNEKLLPCTVLEAPEKGHQDDQYYASSSI